MSATPWATHRPDQPGSMSATRRRSGCSARNRYAEIEEFAWLAIGKMASRLTSLERAPHRAPYRLCPCLLRTRVADSPDGRTGWGAYYHHEQRVASPQPDLGMRGAWGLGHGRFRQIRAERPDLASTAEALRAASSRNGHGSARTKMSDDTRTRRERFSKQVVLAASAGRRCADLWLTPLPPSRPPCQKATSVVGRMLPLLTIGRAGPLGRTRWPAR